MKTQVALLVVVAFVGGLLLSGCATEPQHLSMQQPNGERQAMTVPESTWTGTASGEQTHSVASLVVDTNNNTQQRFDQMAGDMDKIRASGDENVKMNRDTMTKLDQLSDAHDANKKETLARLDDMSKKQGSGSITLFFKTGSAKLDRAQVMRLVRFCDFLAHENHGRKVILVSVGQASSPGSEEYNQKLSEQRSQAPLPVMDKYLVNIPHDFYKVAGNGEAQAPEEATSDVNARYQAVRVIAVYDTSELAENK
jgi:outer membrane protein OmpA-like peptidoglycan-associated protein